MSYISTKYLISLSLLRLGSPPGLVEVLESETGARRMAALREAAGACRNARRKAR